MSETSSLHLIYYGALFAHLARDSSHAGFTVYDSSLHHSVGMGTKTSPRGNHFLFLQSLVLYIAVKVMYLKASGENKVLTGN